VPASYGNLFVSGTGFLVPFPPPWRFHQQCYPIYLYLPNTIVTSPSARPFQVFKMLVSHFHTSAHVMWLLK